MENTFAEITEYEGFKNEINMNNIKVDINIDDNTDKFTISLNDNNKKFCDISFGQKFDELLIELENNKYRIRKNH